MNARTLEEMSAFLRSDLSWRRKELQVFQSAVNGAEASKKQALLRGAVASLYAHWEGFVKTACEAYLEYVRMRRLNLNALSTALIGLSVRKRFEKVSDSKRAESHAEIIAWLLSEWKSRAHLPGREVISAEGNLNPQVLQSLLKGLGLPYPEDAAKAEKTVIEPLLEARNNLAHGEWRIVEESDYERLRIWIDRLLVVVCELIEDSAARQAYRRVLPELV